MTSFDAICRTLWRWSFRGTFVGMGFRAQSIRNMGAVLHMLVLKALCLLEFCFVVLVCMVGFAPSYVYALPFVIAWFIGTYCVVCGEGTRTQSGKLTENQENFCGAFPNYMAFEHFVIQKIIGYHQIIIRNRHEA